MWDLLQSIFYQEPRKLSLSVLTEQIIYLKFYNSGPSEGQCQGGVRTLPSPHTDSVWSVEIGLFDFLWNIVKCPMLRLSVKVEDQDKTLQEC